MAIVVPDVLDESCATRQALERLASKWRVLLIYALAAGPQRHAELRRRLPGITQKVLTETLRGMEADGLVERRVLRQEAPQHVEYSLSALGKTLEGPLQAVCDWATVNVHRRRPPDLRRRDRGHRHGEKVSYPAPSVRGMRRPVLISAVLTAALAAAATLAFALPAAAAEPYLDPSLPVPQRVADLMSRMSLDEKLGQMTQAERGSASAADVTQYRLGSILSGGGSAPRLTPPRAGPT
ncbi:winged helix-turn-helix transcriptional regulator [Dactylosporangium darangshiense]|uniref:winged helix-turn-helix transcriptional regulator n=1 Tax=Dactylosporangium darangshiense TaxID=579108 RepID=UPI0036254775